MVFAMCISFTAKHIILLYDCSVSAKDYGVDCTGNSTGPDLTRKMDYCGNDLMMKDN